jgi:hypothetical protein
MYTCRSGIFIAAVLAAGCSGSIESPYKPGGMGSGASNGSGSTPGMGTGSTSGSGSSLPTGSGGSSNTAGSNGNPTGSGGTGSGATGSGATGSGATGPTCQPGVPATSQIPRLTNLQYDNTIRDLFQISATPSSVLAPDSVGAVDERTWQGYKDAADAVATQVMGDAAAKGRVFSCATQDAACMDQVVNDFGQRAFRRPLSADEKARFRALFDDAANITETGSWDEISSVVLKAFLMSPSFLLRAETASQTPSNANQYPLTSYEVASRLSYMLWDTMPDPDLFAAAASDSLTTPAGILTQAQRMLQSDKARTKVATFHQTYMHMGGGSRWIDVQRDPERYPDFTDDMVPMLSEATAKFFDAMVFDSKVSFQDLLLAPKAFVNAKLAPLYDLPAGNFGAELALTDVDANRPGVFTQVGFLAVNSAFARTSPILRGAFLQKEVLCTQFGSPPDNAQSAPVPTGGQTNRENMDNMTAAPDCVGCHHTFINPTGFALESFDAVGAWQTNELDTGAAIDTNAVVVVGAKEVPVTGPKDLMTAIANSPEAQRCYAKKWVQFAYERSATAEDLCTVDNMAAKLTAGGYTVLDLITDLTQSDSFRIRAQEVAQ